MPVSEVDSPRNTTAHNRRHARRLRAGSLAAAAAVTLLTGCAQGTHDDASIVRTTTNIAGAAVVGIERDTRTACALPSAPDQRSGTRGVTHPGGTAQVPADPQRIVVLDTAALDAVCALGLWERVVGATPAGGPTPQPTYLGTGVQKVPSVGGPGAPDVAAITALHPDLILGAVGDGNLDALEPIAPTVLIGSGSWQSAFSAYADAMGRSNAGAKALEDYRTAARETGAAIGANLSQASVVRFSADDLRVEGSDTFAGQVLADAGVQRPVAQRGASFGVGDLREGDERAKVEGDLIYLMFDGPDGESHGKSVMKDKKGWGKLAAVTDRREFVVEDPIWHGTGVTAARAILTDLQKTLNGYVTD
ncbi:iron-siderophore ABC transporter substrate-binding protein [Nocardia blacklockiae]|uniref:iron-siderophore ABC transporter substrate-binding protein n=1 Tax=Nocardia blacklockiae TaxID=480036 RepID=UPI0018936910|nr:iron-siderophore ABC transporter substrate-binding protein [Nocardia blacklockiae]MBF6176512.1 iron-siderophore ABC transporter substrate-binding protein [Nocardia blacklockiae]